MVYANESWDPLSYENNSNTDWFWDNTTNTLSYIVSNKEGILPFLDVPMVFKAIKCRYGACGGFNGKRPTPPVTTRPSTALYWSQKSTWKKIGTSPLWGGFNGTLPKYNESVLIP